MLDPDYASATHTTAQLDDTFGYGGVSSVKGAQRVTLTAAPVPSGRLWPTKQLRLHLLH